MLKWQKETNESRLVRTPGQDGWSGSDHQQGQGLNSTDAKRCVMLPESLSHNFCLMNPCIGILEHACAFRGKRSNDWRTWSFRIFQALSSCLGNRAHLIECYTTLTPVHTRSWRPPLFVFSQSSLSSHLLHPSTAAARATKLSPLRPSPFPASLTTTCPAPGCLTRLPHGSGYRVAQTETHSKPCIWNLFLCRDTLHFFCIITYSAPSVHFLSGRDRRKTGHRYSFH